MALSGVPASIARLFWELPRDAVSGVPDEEVFAKVCERGTVDDWRWLLATVESDRLRQWFAADARRHLTERSLRVWACILSCPEPAGRPQVPWIHA